MASSILRTTVITREAFDPANEAHLKSLDKYLETGTWGDVQFHPEHPYFDVVTTVLAKFALHTRNIRRETPIERERRLATKTNLVRDAKSESDQDHKARLEKASAQITRE